jgi:hypothetical protein
METIADDSRRPRFSLQKLLLAVTIAAMAIGLFAIAQRNYSLQSANSRLAQENRRLRDITGELSVDDPSRVHAIQLRTQSELEWAWLVWLPEGSRYRLRCEGGEGEIPEKGWPAHGGTIWLGGAGERRIHYSIRRDPVEGKWYGTLSASGGSVGRDDHSWVEWNSKSSTTSGVGNTTESFRKGRRVELYRHRVWPGGSTGPSDLTAGFVIWLEPEP